MLALSPLWTPTALDLVTPQGFYSVRYVARDGTWQGAFRAYGVSEWLLLAEGCKSSAEAMRACERDLSETTANDNCLPADIAF